MNNFENLQEARKVIDKRAIDNRTKNINENLKYRMKISETKEEKIACETILNSQYSLDDKEWLFNGGLFRTNEELEFFKKEKEKEKEKFIESGEWEKFNRHKCHWVWLLPIIDGFFFLFVSSLQWGIVGFLHKRHDYALYRNFIHSFVTFCVNCQGTCLFENRNKSGGNGN